MDTDPGMSPSHHNDIARPNIASGPSPKASAPSNAARADRHSPAATAS